MASKSKNVPCEGCRERKKKCSSGLPCDRCKRLGIECTYYNPALTHPDRFIGTNSKELEAEVDELQRIANSLEDEMDRLQQHDSSLDSSSHDNDPIDSNGGGNLSDAVSTTEELSEITEPVDLVKVNDSMPLQWHMSLGKYGLSLETDIQSFDDLLHQVRIFGQALLRGRKPPSSTMKNGSNTSPSQQSTTMLRRYPIFTPLRRANYRAKLRCVSMNEKDDTPETPTSDTTTTTTTTTTIDPDLIDRQRTLQLLEAYFECQFYHCVMMHRETFYSSFVNGNTDLLSSPVVCSLCAAIITMRCRHIREIIPCDKQATAHTFYLNRARELIATKFDVATLETFMTFLFIALYYINLMHPIRSRKYLELAVRIRHVLAKDYETNKDTDMHEYELFKRLHTMLFDIAHQIDFFNNHRGVPDDNDNSNSSSSTHDKNSNSGSLRQKTQPLSPELAKQISLSKHTPTPLPDEKGGHLRALMKDVYTTRMNAVLHPYLCATRFSTKDTIPQSFAIKMETMYNHYCFTEIPPEYRLSLTIFENDLSDDEFQSRLTNDHHLDITAVCLAIRYYHGLISIHEPFMPSLPRHFTRANHPERPLINCDYTSEPKPSDILLTEQMETYHLRALEVCHRSAIIIVRLLEFLSHKKNICCYMFMPCFLTAWDILMRNACLGLADPEEAQKYAPIRVLKLSRDYCLRCVELLRKAFHFNTGDRIMWEHHQDVENEILSSLFASRPYTADYWDPFSSTSAW
ncbi:hypothetical protein O0I10_002119 [Lichtheimia ornata]|uniref:Zn(2)-C6 fungal-type domain-containing protein n=1 Tax=Lichtheimia ornata TaxID=688661 RepID=A0AAD7VBH0_9FUNG|nr:uncharacterized protein O0I10_002119 [Lichtheimia ornata]KAJ8662425.1 hypothetical protein O0I10_002119 [Lichtheimia ornata]